MKKIITLSVFLLVVLWDSAPGEEIVLKEGVGFDSVFVGETTLDGIIAKFGEPDRFEQTPMKGFENYVYGRLGLEFNIDADCGNLLDTIMTLPHFRGSTARGISLRSSLKDVRRAYGEPAADPTGEGRYLSYLEQGVVIWVKRSKWLKRFQGIEKIVITEKNRPAMGRTFPHIRRRNDYSFTNEVMQLALKGYELFKAKQYESSYGGGHYTDPDPETKVYDFWSDGKIAKVDRDANGDHETYFKILDGNLKYFGSTGARGQWVDAGKGFEYILQSPHNFDLIYK